MKIRIELQEAFERWGMPKSIRFDNGLPWGTASKVPSALALWLVGLGIRPLFGRPRRSTDNAVAERSHGVLNGWVEPKACADLETLQNRLTYFSRFQRERYPACQGHSRLETYPQLMSRPSSYQAHDDAQRWSAQAMFNYLATYRFYRKVEANGRFTLLNREYSLGRRFKRLTVAIRLDPDVRKWIVMNEYGDELAQFEPKGLNYETISTMTLAYSRRR